MSLGSIAHLQYYFARTGLLDGKGGQLAKKKENGEYDIPRLSLGGSDVVDSPIEEEGELLWEAAKEDGEEVMLPPTVSTYSQRTQDVAPPPDQKSLKKDLVDALENTLQALESCEPNTIPDSELPTQGFNEIQGLHILDTTTLAIRAARLYYTLHPNPTQLNQIKADHQIRKDLYNVLEVLKKFAGRNFTGGIREDERLAILVWVSDVGMLIDQEARIEEQERRARQDWHWMDEQAWTGRPIDREMSFLRFLLSHTGQDQEPAAISNPEGNACSAFLQDLADGRKLIRMHNVAVDKSKKPFGHITSLHDDINKPYRRAENLKYWLKAAEIRWEVNLKLDIMGIVNMSEMRSVWSAFEGVVLQWSKVVREELTRDWNVEEERKLHARAQSLAQASPRSSPTKRSSVKVDEWS
jgi:hypothetical protein